MTPLQQIARLGTRLQLALGALGAMRLLALALGISAAGLWFGPHAQWQQQLERQRAALQRLRHSPVPPERAAGDEQANATLGATTLRNVLGERVHAEQQLKTLFALAQHNGVALQTAEYKQSVDRANQLRSWQISVPLHASYASLRGFIEQVLLTMPYAAVNELRFKPDAIGSPTLDGRLRLTLFLNDAPSARPERVQ